MLPQKRDHGVGNRLGLLQQGEMPRLGNFHQTHACAHLVAERTAITRKGPPVIKPLYHKEWCCPALPPVIEGRGLARRYLRCGHRRPLLHLKQDTSIGSWRQIDGFHQFQPLGLGNALAQETLDGCVCLRVRSDETSCR